MYLERLGRISKPPILRQRLVLVIGLLFFFALALPLAYRQSPTVDESVHVFRGVALWQTGQLRFQAKHTPFAHWLNGALLFTEPTLPDVTRLPSWTEDDRPTLARELFWLSEPSPNVDRIFFLARMPVIWLGLILGAMLTRWAGAKSGKRVKKRAQFLAVVLFALAPNLLATFTLATTDGPLTAAFLAAAFTFWRYRQRPSFWRWLLAGVALGLALGSKLTAAILVPLFLLLGYLQWDRSERWWRPAVRWVAILPVAGVVFWALYRFELGAVPGLPFPVPAATYVRSILKFQTDTGAGHQAYLLGELSTDGWWYYFPLTFLLKTPLPTLLLLATAVFLIFRRNRWRTTADFWLPALAVLVAGSLSGLNIGYRHILPALPFLLLLGAITADFWRRQSWRTAVLGLILLWYVGSSVRQYPHPVPYFNELAGGPTGGYRFLGDSNIDWGQDLKLLANYVNNDAGEEIAVSYFGAADPGYYGLESPPLLDLEDGPDFARANPAPGVYAISVNHVLGLGLAESDTFDWFRRRQPDGNLGYSILLYEVAAAADGRWLGHCLDPQPLLDEASAGQLVGDANLRHVYFNCRQSWVFPQDGTPGWYILPRAAWPMAAVFPEHLVPVYKHDATEREPSYAVYYWDGGASLATWAMGKSVAAWPDGTAVSLPLTWDQTAALQGYVVRDESWWTIWRAQAETDAPLTVAGHLYQDAPTPTVADGLGFAPAQWQPGDWFVQFHPFPEGADGRFLETGLYDYLTGERLPAMGNGRQGTFIRLYP